MVVVVQVGGVQILYILPADFTSKSLKNEAGLVGMGQVTVLLWIYTYSPDTWLKVPCWPNIDTNNLEMRAESRLCDTQPHSKVLPYRTKTGKYDSATPQPRHQTHTCYTTMHVSRGVRGQEQVMLQRLAQGHYTSTHWLPIHETTHPVTENGIRPSQQVNLPAENKQPRSTTLTQSERHRKTSFGFNRHHSG